MDSISAKFLEDDVVGIIRRVVGVWKPSPCLGMTDYNLEAAVPRVKPDLPLDPHCSHFPHERWIGNVKDLMLVQ